MILVTGGTGLVGSHLLLELIRSGRQVRAIHRKNSDLQVVKKVFSYYLPSEEVETSFDKIDWKEADVLDIPALEAVFLNVRVVYHCAALVSFDPADAGELRKINIEGTANIVNISRNSKVEKLCHLSSIAALDKSPGEDRFTENLQWFPEKDHSYYAISKHGAEMEVWRGSQEGLPVVILNPGIIIGPGFWNSGSGKIFSEISKGLKYHFPKTTGFVGVWDVVKIAVSLTESSTKNEQYIVVAENLSFHDILDQVALNLHQPLPKRKLRPWMVVAAWSYQSLTQILFGKKKQLRLEDRKSLFQKEYYSNEKLRSKLSYEFLSIKEVIRQTAELFRKEDK